MSASARLRQNDTAVALTSVRVGATHAADATVTGLWVFDSGDRITDSFGFGVQWRREDIGDVV